MGLPWHGLDARVRRKLRWLGVAATVGMFLVLVMGATVTNTGSAQGCGASWPLCKGQFVPSFTVATAIEFSHRAVTGVEGLLVVLLAVGSFAAWPRERAIQGLAVTMVLFLLLQAGLGAAAVLHPQEPAVLASHFGVSLIAFASVLLGTAAVFERESADELRARRVPDGYQRLVIGSLLYLLVVVYLGAYVRHTGVSLGCPDWPLCQGQIFPGFRGPAGIAFAHRLAALGAVLLLGWLGAWSWRLRDRRPDLAKGGMAAFLLVVAQSLSGAVVVFTRLDLFSALLHAAIVALLSGSLAYLAFRLRPVSRPAERARPAAEGATPHLLRG